MSGPGTTSTPLAIVSPVASWRARVLGAPRTRLGVIVGGAAILVVAIIVVTALSFGSEDEAAHARPPDDRVDLVVARAAGGAGADAGIAHAGLTPRVAAEPPSTATAGDGAQQGEAAGTASTAPQTIGAVTDPNALGARRHTRRDQAAADPARPAKRTPSIVREW